MFGSELGKYFSEAQGILAVMAGMFMQFMFSEKRGLAIIITISISAIFVAIFIIPAVLEIFNIDPTSKVANSLYALSAILSVEIIAIITRVLPAALRKKVFSFLGVKDDSSK